jgi:hypothetical protein
MDDISTTDVPWNIGGTSVFGNLIYCHFERLLMAAAAATAASTTSAHRWAFTAERLLTISPLSCKHREQAADFFAVTFDTHDFIGMLMTN